MQVGDTAQRSGGHQPDPRKQLCKDENICEPNPWLKNSNDNWELFKGILLAAHGATVITIKS